MTSSGQFDDQFVRFPDHALLRQGDICRLDDFPTWDVGEASIVSRPDGDSSHLILPILERMQMKDDSVLLSVATHCCDLENSSSRRAITIAPVIAPPASVGDTERPQRLAACGDRDESGTYDWISLFPIGFAGDSSEHAFSLIDWSLATHMRPPKSAFSLLLEGKIAEMSEEARVSYRTKLAAVYGRPISPSDDT